MRSAGGTAHDDNDGCQLMCNMPYIFMYSARSSCVSVTARYLATGWRAKLARAHTKKGRLSLLTHARFEDNSVFCIRYCYLTYRDERKDPELEMRRQLDLPDLLGCILIGCIKFIQSQKEI